MQMYYKYVPFSEPLKVFKAFFFVGIFSFVNIYLHVHVYECNTVCCVCVCVCIVLLYGYYGLMMCKLFFCVILKHKTTKTWNEDTSLIRTISSDWAGSKRHPVRKVGEQLQDKHIKLMLNSYRSKPFTIQM